MRPPRFCARDFAGRSLTLADDASSWERLGTGKDLLILGLGPGNPLALPFVREAGKIFWLEDPLFLKLAESSSPGRLAKLAQAGWREIAPEAARRLADGCQIYFYRPALKINPSFWGPLLAALELGSRQPPPKKSAVWLPGSDSMLLHQELKQALADSGQILTAAPAKGHLADLEKAWQGLVPQFGISVNLRGLDPEGRIFQLCAALEVPLAIWLVDNPFNLLARISLPWWREANIFVTDASFIGPLRQQGAQKVWHCPLAAAAHMRRPIGPGDGMPLFVGRSAFPDKKAYFSGIRLAPEIIAAASAMLAGNSPLPDFHWWAAREGNPVWPDKKIRRAALGADDFSSLNRARWLRAALGAGLRVVGDAAWQDLLPEAPVLPPVDYYGRLADLYQGAGCILNVTSLLLPQSLNQRHFDVWWAGGMLLTDATPGLAIFPEELTRPVAMREPGEVAERLAFFRERPALRRELIGAWRDCVAKEHLYAHRVALMRACLKNGDRPPLAIKEHKKMPQNQIEI